MIEMSKEYVLIAVEHEINHVRGEYFHFYLHEQFTFNSMRKLFKYNILLHTVHGSPYTIILCFIYAKVYLKALKHGKH